MEGKWVDEQIASIVHGPDHNLSGCSGKIVFFFVNRLISEDPVSMVLFVVEEHDIVVNM